MPLWTHPDSAIAYILSFPPFAESAALAARISAALVFDLRL